MATDPRVNPFHVDLDVPKHPGVERERQYRQAVQGVFGTELGKWLLKEMKANTAYAFTPDNQYITAYNMGQQEFVQLMIDITEGR